MENHHLIIVDFPIQTGGSFNSYVNVYQAGYHFSGAVGMPSMKMVMTWGRPLSVMKLAKCNRMERLQAKQH